MKNVIVGQSGGPTAVINASLAGVFKTAREMGADKVYGMLHGVQGLLSGQYIDLSEHIRNDLELDLLKRTPSSYLGSCRYKLPEVSKGNQVYEQIFTLLNHLEIDCFLYIGGNDSMDTIKKLTDYAALIGSQIRFIGVPKTIDNDLACTDHTPGFGSAAKFIGAVTKEAIRDGLVYDLSAVTVIEIMGRNAGWLTAAAALAKDEDCEGVDMLFLPELPFEVEDFMKKVQEKARTKKSLVIGVSEGIRLSDGRFVCELASASGSVDAFGHKMMQGAAKYLADRLHLEFGMKTRAIELSTLQRSASHLASQVDVSEAFLVGGAAVAAAFEGKTGMVVTLQRLSQKPYSCSTGLSDVHEIANVEKKVPSEWITQDGAFVSAELLDYIRPLIQGESAPVMVNGLPRHLRLKL